MLHQFYSRFVAPNSKAIAGLVAGAVLAGLRLAGVELVPDAAEGLRAFFEGLVIAAAVWVAPRNQ